MKVSFVVGNLTAALQDGAIESGVRCAREVMGIPFDSGDRPRSKLLARETLVEYSTLEKHVPAVGTMARGAALGVLLAGAAAAYVGRSKL